MFPEQPWQQRLWHMRQLDAEDVVAFPRQLWPAIEVSTVAREPAWERAGPWK